MTAATTRAAAAAIELIERLREREIHLWLDGERLRFRAPDGALTAELREAIAGLRGELVAFLRGAGAAAPAVMPLAPVAREPGAGVPLSFAQQRLWFIDRLVPGSSAYNIPLALALRGALDDAALERALAEIVRRHEVLRTTFAEIEGEPRQLVGDAVPALPCIDLSALAVAARRRELRRLAREEAGRPFDLERGPICRSALVRSGEHERALLVTIHHVAADGWSLGVLVRELTVLYGAFVERRPSPLPALPIQYADFAWWQRRWLTGDELERQLAFWRGQLEGAPTALELPTDRPRPAVASHRGDSVPLVVPAELGARLAALGRGERASLFMVFLAAIQVLLLRSTGRDDLVVGSPIAGRNRAEIEGLIGFFVNTLALRLRGARGQGFRALVARARDLMLDAYAHQDLPFEKLVEEIHPERDLARHPLFQVAIALQNSPGAPLALPGLEIGQIGNDRPSATFDWTLNLVERAQGVSGSFQLATEIFDRTTIQRFAARLVRLLEAAVAAPERPVERLALLGAAETHQLCLEWSPWAGDVRARDLGRVGGVSELCGYDREATVPELFAAWARHRPEAPALVVSAPGGVVQIRYGELERRANQLAHHLRGLGVGPEVPVALALERSPAMVVAILGILEAGGFYVPLDVSYPQERLAYVLATTATKVLITTREQKPRLPEHGAREVLLDDAAAAIAAEPETAPAAMPETGARAENLAYVMFTSGSTGRPKGVAVCHRAVVRLVRENDFVAMDAGEVVAHHSSSSFDASTLELWAPLLNGGRLALFPAERPTLEQLGALIGELGVSTMWLTAALFHQMVEHQLPALCGLRQLLAGGEVISPEHARRVLEAAPGLRFCNGYGPTESTTFTSTHGLRRASELRTPVPIGRPIAHTGAVLLDRDLEPVPLGVLGDLHAAGDGLARGYFGAPRLTAERFVPAPGGLVPGERLYRTGDQVRWLGDGTLDFVGRVDHQVKVRGFRIELEEVETALRALPGVREAVVVAVANDDGIGKRLIAYVVTAASEEAEPGRGVAGLRAALAERLPEYMVPALFVPMAALPLSPTGKVDRAALPTPASAGLGEERVRIEPATPTEITLARIWGEVLGREQVGADDNFFDLGGHSLLATQVVSRVRVELGVELQLRHLFETKSLGELCRVIDALLAATAPALMPLAPVAREPGVVLPLSFAQQRLWFIDRLALGSAAYNVPLGLMLRGALDEAALERAMAEIVRRHEVLRTTFAEIAGEPCQVVGAAPARVLPRIDLRALPAAARRRELRRLTDAEAVRPFDLARGPICRSALVHSDEDERALLVTIHHIAADGWSLGVLVRELTVLYAAWVERRPSPLPELPVQYADFAWWQRRWLTGDELERQLAFWRDQLTGAPAALELPTDRPRPAVASHRGDSVPFTLGGALSARLAALGRAESASTFMVFLAALQALLLRTTGRDDAVVGSPIAGRNRAEIEGLIGFFVNTLALRLRGARGRGLRRLVAQARDLTLDAYAHQDLPFEKLVEEIQPERDLARHPLFQVAIALQNAPAGALELPGLTIGNLAAEYPSTKFDWTLNLVEGPQGVSGSFQLATDLFDRTTIQRFARSFVRLLETAAAAPETAVEELSLWHPAERHQLAVEWNDTRTPPPGTALLPERLAEHARLRPAALAVLGPAGETWSYAELDRRCDQLAERLRRRGVGPEVRVGVALARSNEWVAAFLAVLRAGGVYVPLDPSYPAERLRFILEDAALELVISHTEIAAALPREVWAGISVATLLIDVEDEPPAVPVLAAAVPTADSAAYMIYTSGSTGKPKGVLLTHRGLANLVAGQAVGFEVGADDRILQFASANFDASVWDVAMAFSAGAALVLTTAEARISPPALAELIAARGVTLTLLPPTVLALLDPAAVPLRVLLSGGEACPEAQVRRWAPGRQMVNAYGPTEITVCATLARLSERSAGPPPIGRPVGGVRLAVLDRAGAPVSLGAAGELVIGGAGVGRGYHRRPGLTAERFVPDAGPGAGPGARCYRSGDLVRWRRDGQLDYLGRVDHQVKVRGFRIELGEIETALRALDAVREAVVAAQPEPGGGQRLVAWVVLHDTAHGAAVDLRAALAGVLPDYMVPAIVMPLEALPLNANGKVDRALLPAPDASLLPGREHVEPRTTTEKALAAIWGEVLGVAEVGAGDNFFTLGGHSLLATQVLSRIKVQLGVELPLRDLFETKTLAELAERIDAHAWALEAATMTAGTLEEGEI